MEEKYREVENQELAYNENGFVLVVRDKKIKRKSKMRIEVERLNGRLDRDYMFNDYLYKDKKR